MITNTFLQNPNDYSPQRIGLSYLTKEIVIEYMIVSLKKLYHHKINLAKVTDEMDIESIIDDIYTQHFFYLNHSDISSEYISNAVCKLLQIEAKAKGKGINKKYCRQSTGNTKEDSFESNEDYNRLVKEELDAKKQEMDKCYEENRITINDENFQYDIREDFDCEIYDAEWDD